MGGLAPTVDELAFRQYFEQFGAVEDAVVMYDHDTKRPRGFGFITFVLEDTVDQVLPFCRDFPQRDNLQKAHQSVLDTQCAQHLAVCLTKNTRGMFKLVRGAC